jgi:serine/threonine protein kinase
MSGLEALLTGRLLAERYRIEAVIGRGGMGAVYRASDERLGRKVAVKVITVSGPDEPGARERLRQRFLREARAAAALPHHPNVVPVYDFGTDPGLGLDFLVMELLQGEDLSALLARAGPPPLEMGLRILHEAARGLAVGHRFGLVHRDVKPGNIFLVRDDHGEPQIRVLDFGIAKLVDDDTLSQLTQDGRLPLSPSYASPEQLRGLSQITPASDVFSLGAVAFQLLSGQRPFDDTDRNRLSLGMPVPVPSLRQHEPSISPAVDEVIRKALRFDPTDRFPDAAAFAAVLEQARRESGEAAPSQREPFPVAFPGGMPSVTTPTEDRTEFLEDRTLLEPQPSAPAAGAAARPQPESYHRVPLPPRRRERSNATGWLVTFMVVLVLAGAGAVFALYTLGEREPIVTEAPPPPEVPPVEPEEPLEIEPEPTELDAFVHNQEGQRYYRGGDFERALEQFQRAVQISPGNADYRYNYALTLLRLRIPGEAAREFERVLRQDPARPAAHFNLAEARLALGDTTGAIASLENLLDVSTDPVERGRAERRLRDLRAAVLAPEEETPEPVPPAGPPPFPGGAPGASPEGPPGQRGTTGQGRGRPTSNALGDR